MLTNADYQGGNCWRLGWLWQLLNIRQQWSLPHWVFLSWTSSHWHAMLFDSIFIHRTFFRIGVSPPKSCHCFIDFVFGVFLMVYCFVHSKFTRSRLPFQENTFFAHSWGNSTIQALGDCRNSVTASGSTSHSASLVEGFGSASSIILLTVVFLTWPPSLNQGYYQWHLE